MPFNRGELKHSGGRNKTKHGFSLRDLPSFLQNYLAENNQFKEIEDDKTIQILFKMRELEFRNNHTHKIYYCPFTKHPSTLEEIYENANRVEFKCYHCSKDIYPIYNVFTYRNVVCDSCYETYEEKFDEKDLVTYLDTFRVQVSKLLTEEQQFLIKYIKRNSKLKLSK